MWGVACITSNTALRTRSTVALRVAQMPSASPVIAASGTVTSTIARVCMASAHNPKIAR